MQPTMFAIACAAVGRIDEAFSLLDRACEDRDPWFAVNRRHWPDFDPLRGDPRFSVLLDRVGLDYDPRSQPDMFQPSPDA